MQETMLKHTKNFGHVMAKDEESSKKFIVFLDDELGSEKAFLEDLQKAVRKNLGLDYEVVSFSCCADCWRFLEKNTKSTVAAISDYEMPDIDGVDFLNEVNQLNPKIRCAIITSWSDKISMIKKNKHIHAVVDKSGNMEDKVSSLIGTLCKEFIKASKV
jgi:DNA-binding NtrC family response regulator